jgi:hypothetical protein
MPAEPIFKSSRSQSVAVALASALLLLGAIALAYLQAGGASASTRQAQNTAPRTAAPRASKLWLNYPDTWKRTEAAPETFVLADPDRPARRLKIVTLQSRAPMSPEQMLEQSINTRIDAAALENMRQAEPRIVFASNEFGFAGAEFLGISQTTRGPEVDGIYELHLLACLSNDGVNYWLLYLTDTTAPGEDLEPSLKTNATLLRAIYRSARFDNE